MDKRYFTIIKEKSQEILKNKQQIAKLIEKSGVIKRRRKIKSATVLVDAIFLMFLNDLSYRRLSLIMTAKYGILMSETAWEKQISKCMNVFLKMALMNDLHINAASGRLTYLIDATNVRQCGKSGNIMRLHCSYSLEKRIIDEFHISDDHKSESLCNFKIHPNSLYIADRAYGRTAQMEHVLKNNADFLLRIAPNQVCLYSSDDCIEKISFANILNNADTDKITFPCYIKCHKARRRITVAALKIPDEKLVEAERKNLKKAKKKQYRLLEITKLYNKWMILATSLDAPPESLFESYCFRWQIELLFKRSKSCFGFHRIRRGSSKYALLRMAIWCVCIRIASSVASDFSLPLFDFFSLFAAFFP